MNAQNAHSPSFGWYDSSPFVDPDSTGSIQTVEESPSFSEEFESPSSGDESPSFSDGGLESVAFSVDDVITIVTSAEIVTVANAASTLKTPLKPF